MNTNQFHHTATTADGIVFLPCAVRTERRGHNVCVNPFGALTSDLRPSASWERWQIRKRIASACLRLAGLLLLEVLLIALGLVWCVYSLIRAALNRVSIEQVVTAYVVLFWLVVLRWVVIWTVG